MSIDQRIQKIRLSRVMIMHERNLAQEHYVICSIDSSLIIPLEIRIDLHVMRVEMSDSECMLNDTCM